MRAIPIIAAAVLTSALDAQSAFTYQGRLDESGMPANGIYDLQFGLYLDSTGDFAAAEGLCRDDVQVVDGVFTVNLDFGAEAMRANALWLGIVVRAEVQDRPCGEPTGFVQLEPFQPLAGTPYSMRTRGLDVDPNGYVGIGGNSAAHISKLFLRETGTRMALYAESGSNLWNEAALYGVTTGTNGNGVLGFSPNGTEGRGVWGYSEHGTGVAGTSPNGYAGKFFGPIGTSQSFGFLGVISRPQPYSVYIAAPAAETLSFYTGHNARLTVGPTGDVAIGGNTTGYRLTVQRDAADGHTAAFLSENRFGTVLSHINSAAGGHNYTWISTGPDHWNGPGCLSLRDVTAGVDRLTIDRDGCVGIGTGEMSGFQFVINGEAAKPGGGAWSVFSDARLKTDIAPMTGTLDRLLALHGYEFDYTPEAVSAGRGRPGRQIGLIAQEVQEIFPDWVEPADDGSLYVTERATTALMVEALRDLRAEKDRQLARNEAHLKAALLEKDREISDLKRRLDRLEAALTRP